jgi:hypothetical protein
MNLMCLYRLRARNPTTERRNIAYPGFGPTTMGGVPTLLPDLVSGSKSPPHSFPEFNSHCISNGSLGRIENVNTGNME